MSCRRRNRSCSSCLGSRRHRRRRRCHHRVHQSHHRRCDCRQHRGRAPVDRPNPRALAASAGCSRLDGVAMDETVVDWDCAWSIRSKRQWRGQDCIGREKVDPSKPRSLRRGFWWIHSTLLGWLATKWLTPEDGWASHDGVPSGCDLLVEAVWKRTWGVLNLGYPRGPDRGFCRSHCRWVGWLGWRSRCRAFGGVFERHSVRGRACELCGRLRC